MGKVVMYGSVSVDGFVADENDQPGPLFDWLSGGDVPLDGSGALKVSQASYDHTRPYWDRIGVTVVGRHVFDMTDGWDGKPPGGIDHVVVVTHRGRPEGWHPEAPFHFVDGVEAAVATAHGLADDRVVEVAAGDVGGQVRLAEALRRRRSQRAPLLRLGSGRHRRRPARPPPPTRPPQPAHRGTCLLPLLLSNESAAVYPRKSGRTQMDSRGDLPVQQGPGRARR